ncbi:hypothetical protein N7474_008527 [Penicillium riverlandense]|uniref:uncharacterized protein n=1 Tax=Penicillium riverlandense TaxID=1903569 RepID=UPI00254877E1|nr:uncharacterized protein N7474_008527 [Penicillium riverlandense]KAJ5812226.1 hypothetical protein N7474_008527 [Penicillium riverlandense]
MTDTVTVLVSRPPQSAGDLMASRVLPPKSECSGIRGFSQGQGGAEYHVRETDLFRAPTLPPSDEGIELEPHQFSTAMSFPEGGRKAWLVVFSSFCLIAATFGLTASIGLFQSHWQSDQLSNYSSQDIAWISSTQVFLTLFLGVQIGPLFDRYGPRYLTFVGSVGCVSYLLLLGQCTKYWQFLLCFGVLGGTSGAILTTVALSVISHWFKARRGLATGITFTGTSLGGIVFPLALRSILSHMSWAWSMRVLALFVFILVLFGNIFVRGRLPTQEQGGVISLRSFRDARFVWTTAGISLRPLTLTEGFEFVLFTAIGLLPTYALDQGFGRETSFNVIAIMNA